MRSESLILLAAAVLPAVLARPGGGGGGGGRVFQRKHHYGSGNKGGQGSSHHSGGSGSHAASTSTSASFPAYYTGSSGSSGSYGSSGSSSSSGSSGSSGHDSSDDSSKKSKSSKSSKSSATGGGGGYSAAAATPTKTGSGAAVTGSSSGSGGGSAQGALSGGSGVGGTTCTVTELAQVTASAAACSNVLLDGLTIPASSTLSVTVPSGGALLFGGTMTVEYTPDASYTPIVIKGSNAKVAGLAGAVIDGQGSKYWDGEGSNGGTKKPDHFFKLSDMESSTIEQLTIKNWPTHLFSIDGCTDITISNMVLDNSAGDETNSDGDALGHNTDAFDVSKTDGLYIDSATVYNQDDCVAVNSGSNMVFENMYCSGGHGLSIGSIDTGVTVKNVTFKDSSVVKSMNACRIKTDADGSDSTVSDITYSNITISDITKYAIDIQQDYDNGSPTGKPSTAITISGVTFSSITGTTSGDDAYSYYILCGSTESCQDFTFTDIDITGGKTECSPSGAGLCPA